MKRILSQKELQSLTSARFAGELLHSLEGASRVRLSVYFRETWRGLRDEVGVLKLTGIYLGWCVTLVRYLFLRRRGPVKYIYSI